MIQPEKVKAEAKKKEAENIKFRSCLKCHADEEELDRQFLELHNRLFKDYDCSKCRNCCKMYRGSIPPEDVQTDAAYLKITPEHCRTALKTAEYIIEINEKLHKYFRRSVFLQEMRMMAEGY